MEYGIKEKILQKNGRDGLLFPQNIILAHSILASFPRPSISENFPEDVLRFSQVFTHAWMSAERFQESYWSWAQSDAFMKEL